MKKVFQSNDFIIAFLLVAVVSACSLIAINKTSNLCGLAKTCAKPNVSAGTTEIFWDVFPRQFINSILFR